MQVAQFCCKKGQFVLNVTYTHFFSFFFSVLKLTRRQKRRLQYARQRIISLAFRQELPLFMPWIVTEISLCPVIKHGGRVRNRYLGKLQQWIWHSSGYRRYIRVTRGIPWKGIPLGILLGFTQYLCWLCPIRQNVSKCHASVNRLVTF